MFEEIINALLEPVEVLEIAPAAGGADALHAVKRITIRDGAAGEIIKMLGDEIHAGVDGGVAEISLALQTGFALEIVLRDVERSHAGGGHAEAGVGLLALAARRVGPRARRKLGIAPGFINDLPISQRDHRPVGIAGAVGGPDAQDAHLPVA